MSKPKVLITQPDVPDECLDSLKERCDVTIWHKAGPIPRSKLLSMITGVDALLCMPTDKISDKVLQAAGPQLKVVASMSDDINHLDIESLKERNIKIGYTPNIRTESTVELVIELLLATARKSMQTLSLNNDDQVLDPMHAIELTEKTVGIVGLGRIGVRVAEILKSFNVAKILYTSRTVKSKASKFDGEKVDFLTLLENSDFIINVALTSTSYIFTDWDFDLVKNTAIFVNISHGNMVDPRALIEALNADIISAAGLLVTNPKLLPVGLLELDNCLVFHHIDTEKNKSEMARMTLKNIMAVLDKKPAEMAAEYV